MKKGKNNFYEDIDSEKIDEFKLHLNNTLTTIQKKIFSLRYDKDGNILFSMEEIANRLNTTHQNINLILDIIHKTKKRIINKDYTPNENYYLKELRESHKKELIETIHKLHRLPTKGEKGKPEAIFSNGSNQMTYYNNLRRKTENILNAQQEFGFISEEDQKVLDDYNEIQSILNKYLIENANIISNKTREFIKVIIKNRINNKKRNTEKAETYYRYLKRQYQNIISKKTEKNEQLTIKEKQKNTDYNAMKNVLSFFPYSPISNQILVDQFCKTNYIDTEINQSLLQKPFYEIYTKVLFLIDNNIPVLNRNGTINQILFMSDLNMQEIYNISIEELVMNYITGIINSSEAIKTMII